MATAAVNTAPRRQNGKRLGLGLSAAGGLVVGAGLRAAGAGLVVGAAPLGVALAAGSLVVFADARRLQRQRKQCSPVPSATVEPAASVVEPELAPLGVEEAQEQELQLSAAPAVVGTSTDEHNELVGAMLEAVAASPDKAAAPAAADGGDDDARATAPAAGPAVLSQEEEQEEEHSGSVDLPAPIKSASPDLLPSGSTDLEDSAAASDCEPESPLAAACDDAIRAVGPDAGLPPLAAKKKKTATKKIKKSLSKSLKKIGRALSINNSDASAATVEAAVSSPTAARPPAGPQFGAFLRRSFSNDCRRTSISSLADSAMASELAVDKSEGSQTIRKMKDLLRRSFTLSTPRASLDVSAKGSSMVMA